MKHFFWLFLILVVKIDISSAATLSIYSSSPLDPPPQIFLKDSSGASLELEDLKGKITLLNFWAPWCAPCRKEMPSLNRLSQHFQGKNFQAILVTSKPFKGENPSSYLKRQGFQSLECYFDQNGKTTKGFGVQALPTTLFLNAEGKIIAHMVGSAQMDSPEMIGFVNSLLDKGNMKK